MLMFRTDPSDQAAKSLAVCLPLLPPGRTKGLRRRRHGTHHPLAGGDWETRA
jgi:hypothetical protein